MDARYNAYFSNKEKGGHRRECGGRLFFNNIPDKSRKEQGLGGRDVRILSSTNREDISERTFIFQRRKKEDILLLD